MNLHSTIKKRIDQKWHPYGMCCFGWFSRIENVSKIMKKIKHEQDINITRHRNHDFLIYHGKIEEICELTSPTIITHI